MASGGQPAESLSIKVWELKTPIHCAGCQKKIKKILNNIEGVIETDIDATQSKVTVKAIVDSDVLIKRLAKHGKHAQLFPQPKPPENPTKPPSPEPKQSPENPEKPAPSPPPTTKPAEATTVEKPTKHKEQQPPPKPSETSATTETKATEGSPRTEDKITEAPKSAPPAEKAAANEAKEATENSESKQKENKGENSGKSSDVSGDSQPEKLAVQPVYHHYHHPVYSPELQLSYNVVQPSVSNAYYASPVATAPRGQEYVYSPEYYYGQAMEGSSSAVVAPGYESMSMFSEENPNACILM